MNQKTRKLITMFKALHHIEDVDCLSREKKIENDSPALKIASMHRYKNSKTRQKNAEED